MCRKSIQETVYFTRDKYTVNVKVEFIILETTNACVCVFFDKKILDPRHATQAFRVLLKGQHV